jgi:hypothetical protein
MAWHRQVHDRHPVRPARGAPARGAQASEAAAASAAAGGAQAALGRVQVCLPGAPGGIVTVQVPAGPSGVRSATGGLLAAPLVSSFSTKP